MFLIRDESNLRKGQGFLNIVLSKHYDMNVCHTEYRNPARYKSEVEINAKNTTHLSFAIDYFSYVKFSLVARLRGGQNQTKLNERVLLNRR